MASQYAPASGTEAMDFFGKWCGRCICDIDDDCPVAAVGCAYGLGAGKPPVEWQYERGEPVCIAFAPIDPLDVPYMRSAASKICFPHLAACQRKVSKCGC